MGRAIDVMWQEGQMLWRRVVDVHKQQFPNGAMVSRFSSLRSRYTAALAVTLAGAYIGLNYVGSSGAQTPESEPYDTVTFIDSVEGAFQATGHLKGDTVTHENELAGFVAEELKQLRAHKRIDCDQFNTLQTLRMRDGRLAWPVCRVGMSQNVPRVWVFARIGENKTATPWVGVFYKRGGEWQFANVATGLSWAGQVGKFFDLLGGLGVEKAWEAAKNEANALPWAKAQGYDTLRLDELKTTLQTDFGYSTIQQKGWY